MSERAPSDHGRPRPGRLITFEGGEGAGKSTQVARLRERLVAAGHDVVATREPGGSPRAEAIRAGLLAGQAARFGALAEALLFAAARGDHVAQTIRPALGRGAVVLCDRFVDSTRVYQGAAAGLPELTLDRLERAATGGTRPDLTLVFDLPAEVGMARADARRRQAREGADRFEGEGIAYHRRIREAFLEIAAAEPARCVVIDGAAEPEAAAEAVWRAVGPLVESLGEGLRAI